MGLSTYSKNTMLDFVFGAGSFTPPTTVYLSIHTADPGLTGANEINDATETWYVRQSITFAAPSGSERFIDSNVLVSFPIKSTAGNITGAYYGLWDAATNGNFLGSGNPADEICGQNQRFLARSGNVTFTINTGAIVNAHVQEILNHIFRNTAMTDPGTVYGALFTASPGDTGVVTNEVAASVGYSRQAVTFGSASGGVISSNAEVSYGPATGAGFGTPTHIAITKGNTRAVTDLLWYLPITPGTDEIVSGLTLKLPSGDIDLTS